MPTPGIPGGRWSGAVALAGLDRLGLGRPGRRGAAGRPGHGLGFAAGRSGLGNAARLAGASPQRIWRQLVWPVVRPGAARAAGMVFALTLIEPGAPLVLGRRTLGFQIVEAALGPEPAPRAAVLALTATVLAFVARVLVRWWGGPPEPVVDRIRPESRSQSRGPRRPDGPAARYVAALAIGVILAWLPVLALFASADGGLGALTSRPPRGWAGWRTGSRNACS